MTITHDSYTFEDAKHGVIQEGKPEAPIIVGRFPGIKGESHLIDKPKGYFLSCEICIDGYETAAALDTALDTIRNKSGTLTGTLTGSSSQSFTQCTFIDIDIDRKFYDAISDNWVAFARLNWQRRTP